MTLRPVVHRNESHELRIFVDEIDARERGADEWTDTVQRELINLFGSTRGEERVHDLSDRHELSQSEIRRRLRNGAERFWRRRHRSHLV